MVVPLASVSNAGMARVQGLPSGEPHDGHLLRYTLLQGNNPCCESMPCIILCLGYKGDMIKDYFLCYDEMNNDFTLALGQKTKSITFHH